MSPRDEVSVNVQNSVIEATNNRVSAYGSLDSCEDGVVDMIPTEDEKLTTTNSDKPSNEYVLNVAFFSFVGFLSIQAAFALIANSQSMLADSEAMSIDAMTYLCNMVAERMKNKPLSENELLLPPEVCRYRREHRKLLLELVPPAISVTTLLSVTVYTLREAIRILRGIEAGTTDDVSVPVMLTFSSLNLLLDFVNVSCFARSHSLFNLDQSIPRDHGEKTPIIFGDEETKCCDNHCLLETDTPERGNRTSIITNLNMCSAWTHICADTLRSLAVVIAANIAFFIPSVDGGVADSVAAIVVSVIIFFSLIPLARGLVQTGIKMVKLRSNAPFSS